MLVKYKEMCYNVDTTQKLNRLVREVVFLFW